MVNKCDWKIQFIVWYLQLESVPVTSQYEVQRAAIIRLNHQNKPIRETAKTLGVTKSTVWYILKKKEHTGEPRKIS